MKRISTYIAEKLHINNTTKLEYMYHPKDKDELIECIKDKIEKEGLGTEENPLDLNDIDTSNIIDMSYLFDVKDVDLMELSKKGYFDISNWNVSKVRNMSYMFVGSKFNGDISDWNVSNVKNMKWMFMNSSFNGDISDWNVSNVENMSSMFAYSSFTGKNGNISKWKVKENTDMIYMFGKCPLESNPPKWYK